MLALLGGGLFVAVRRQISGQLDASLQAASAALMQAARIRETEQAHAKGAVVDAVDELRIPDRLLYLLDSSGRPIKPERAPDWIQAAAREAASTGRTDRTLRAPADPELRLHAERFTGSTGTVYVAAASGSPGESPSSSTMPPPAPWTPCGRSPSTRRSAWTSALSKRRGSSAIRLSSVSCS